MYRRSLADRIPQRRSAVPRARNPGPWAEKGFFKCFHFIARGVLRLRAIKPFACDRSVRRSAQDDVFAGVLKKNIPKQVSAYGAAFHPFRPMYTGANIEHPSREEGFVLGSTFALPTLHMVKQLIWTALSYSPLRCQNRPSALTQCSPASVVISNRGTGGAAAARVVAIFSLTFGAARAG
jgi:hypothetical protein